MGNFRLHVSAVFVVVVVVWMLLLAGHGTNAARVKLQRSSHETRLQVQGLLGQDSPLLHTGESGSPAKTHYLAKHLTKETDQGYYGFIATMDVYGFSLSTDQYTATTVQLYNRVDGSEARLSLIQVGWEVSSNKYNDSHTHLAVAWTADGHRKTGCSDAHCALGFQPEKGASIASGGVIQTVSQPMGLKQSITIKITKDGVMGDWLVYYALNQEKLTLFERLPKSLFIDGMASRATGIQFGGHVASPAIVLAPMVSGYGPMVDVMASASMSNIQLIDQNGHVSPMTEQSFIFMTDSHVYTATHMENGRFFYGGPVQPTTLPNQQFLDRGQGFPRATWFLEGNRWWFITLLVGYCMMVLM